MRITYDALREIAEHRYAYDSFFTEFKILSEEDDEYMVEINELGKKSNRLKIKVTVEEI